VFIHMQASAGDAMIVEDFDAIRRRLRALKPGLVSTAPECPLPSERNTEYRHCRRQCGQLVHGVTPTCDGSCHIA